MTDLFTQAVASEVARIQAQIGNGMEAQLQESNVTEAVITPQQVLEVMQRRGDWLSEFEEALQQSADRVVDRALGRLQQGLQSKSAFDASSLQAGANKGLERVLGKLFNRGRQVQKETGRSQNSGQRYRLSRGQVNEAISRQLSQGERYR